MSAPVPVVLLLSGGMDSSLLAATAPAGSVALFIEWNQPALDMERTHARATAQRFGLMFRRLSVNVGMGQMATGVGEPGPRVVGGRNLLFLAMAVSVACEMGIKRVWFGASYGDHKDYPDCRSDFVDAIGMLAAGAYGVTIRAPLFGTPRADIIRRCRELELETWSCYEPAPGLVPCGTCNACRRTVV